MKAKVSMDVVAQGINEGQRRREIIKGVLASGKGTPDSSTISPNGTILSLKPRIRLAVGVVASVKLVKRLGNVAKSREGADADNEKDQVEKMEVELKRCEVFIRKLAKEAVDLARKAKHLMISLYMWADAFGEVIGISPDLTSEAFDAFEMVLKARIIPICEDLERIFREKLLPHLSLLVGSMINPSRLFEAMHTLEPLHYGFLNLDSSKSRSRASLLEASQSYIALRGQLFAELPQYLALLQKGITAAIIHLAGRQTTFYKEIHTHWNELWDALSVEEDSSLSDARETVQIWWERFSIMDECLKELEILKRPKSFSDSEIISETMIVDPECLEEVEILTRPKFPGSSPAVGITKTSGGIQSSAHHVLTSAEQERHSKVYNSTLGSGSVGASRYRMSLQDDQTIMDFNRASCSTGDAWSYDQVYSIADDTQSTYSDF